MRNTSFDSDSEEQGAYREAMKDSDEDVSDATGADEDRQAWRAGSGHPAVHLDELSPLAPSPIDPKESHGYWQSTPCGNLQSDRDNADSADEEANPELSLTNTRTDNGRALPYQLQYGPKSGKPLSSANGLLTAPPLPDLDENSLQSAAVGYADPSGADEDPDTRLDGTDQTDDPALLAGQDQAKVPIGQKFAKVSAAQTPRQTAMTDSGSSAGQLQPEDLQLLLKTDALKYLHSEDLVQQRVEVLQGVSKEARHALKEVMNIDTILDLATSIAFRHASQIHRAADNPQELFAAAGRVPLDYMNDGYEEQERRPEVLINMGVDVLRGIFRTVDDLPRVKAALDVKTVRDVALYPPYIAALIILSQIHPVLADNGVDDPDAPAELQPKVGVFSTEKVSYQRVFVDQFTAAPGSLIEIAPDIPSNPAPPLAPGMERPLPAPSSSTGGQRSGPEGGPKEGGAEPAATAQPKGSGDSHSDPTMGTAESPSGPGMVNLKGGIDMTTSSQVNQPVLGAAVTIQQEWFQEGVALGSLLYSVALAPGESTRIAVTEASSSTKTSSTETMSQTEQSDTSTTANRSIQDVVKSMQDSRTLGTQTQDSSAYGASASGEASYSGFGAHASASFYASHNDSKVSSDVGMAGQSNTAASAVQNAVDGTHQAAVSSRNQRAAMVTEVTQEQSKTTTSRVLVNYNRMHALTMQYYEVVQMYRVATAIAEVKPLLFIPMAPITTWTLELLLQYSLVLAAAAPTPAIRALFESYNRPQDMAMMSQSAPPAAKLPTGAARDLQRTVDGLKQAGHNISEGPGQPWYLPINIASGPATNPGTTPKTQGGSGTGTPVSPDPSKPAPSSAGTAGEPQIDPKSAAKGKQSSPSQPGSTVITAVRLSPTVGMDTSPIVYLRLVGDASQASPKPNPSGGTDPNSNSLLSDSVAISCHTPVNEVTSVEVCTLNIEVEFCLQIDLQVTWPVSKSDDTAPAPLPPADLTPPGISVTTYTVYFSNPYDASLAQATAGDQEAADTMRALLWTLDGEAGTKARLLNMINGAGDTGAAEVSYIAPKTKTPARLAPFSVVEFEVMRSVDKSVGDSRLAAIQELSLDSLRYNQAIWASMEPTALSMHLASYSYNGAPLFGQIEPEPVAVTGNLLGFVMRGDEDMSFGGADLPNLWETVAQDLWMAQFEARQQALRERSSAARSLQPRTTSSNSPDPTTALTKAIQDADAARKQQLLTSGSPETQQLFLSLMALKRATRSQRRRAELDTQQAIIADKLQKDLDAEVRVITDDVDYSLQEANDLLAGQGVETSTNNPPPSDGQLSGTKAKKEDDDDNTPPDVFLASLAEDTGPDSNVLYGSWGAWKKARGLDGGSWSTDYTTVSLPTGGVFAEAVLGRFNAAEKKDYLRFTEWDKYKTAASMATNFNAQRSDGLLQNASASTATAFDKSGLIKGKSFDFSDVMNLADQAQVGDQVFAQLTGGAGMSSNGGSSSLNLPSNNSTNYNGMGNDPFSNGQSTN